MEQDGDTIDILVQRPRNKKAAERFFRRLLKDQGREPRWLMTDKLKIYDAAHWTVMAVWSKNSKAAGEIQDNAAAQLRKTDLKQIL